MANTLFFVAFFGHKVCALCLIAISNHNMNPIRIILHFYKISRFSQKSTNEHKKRGVSNISVRIMSIWSEWIACRSILPISAITVIVAVIANASWKRFRHLFTLNLKCLIRTTLFVCSISAK